MHTIYTMTNSNLSAATSPLLYRRYWTFIIKISTWADPAGGQGEVRPPWNGSDPLRKNKKMINKRDKSFYNINQ